MNVVVVSAGATPDEVPPVVPLETVTQNRWRTESGLQTWLKMAPRAWNRLRRSSTFPAPVAQSRTNPGDPMFMVWQERDVIRSLDVHFAAGRLRPAGLRSLPAVDPHVAQRAHLIALHEVAAHLDIAFRHVVRWLAFHRKLVPVAVLRSGPDAGTLLYGIGQWEDAYNHAVARAVLVGDRPLAPRRVPAWRHAQGGTAALFGYRSASRWRVCDDDCPCRTEVEPKAKRESKAQKEKRLASEPPRAKRPPGRPRKSAPQAPQGSRKAAA